MTYLRLCLTVLLAGFSPCTVSGVEIKGTVFNQSKPLGRVDVRVERLRDRRALGYSTTDAEGRYSIVFEPDPAPVVVFFKPSEARAYPSQVQLLNGLDDQDLNIVVKSGTKSAVAYSVMEGGGGGGVEIATTDLGVTPDQELLDGIDDLTDLEQLFSRSVGSTPEDDFGQQLRSRVVEILQGMPQPRAVTGQVPCRKELKDAYINLRARVFSMFGVPNIVSVGQPSVLVPNFGLPCMPADVVCPDPSFSPWIFGDPDIGAFSRKQIRKERKAFKRGR